MEWLINNPIANMPGLQFLAFFSCVAVTTIITCWVMLKNTDKSDTIPPLQIPTNPDPYEITYLRGQENEVIRLAVFNLYNKGFVKLTTDYVEVNPQHPDPKNLPNIEKSLFGWLSQQKPQIYTNASNASSPEPIRVKPHQIFLEMKARAETYCGSYKANLEKNHLVPSDILKDISWKLRAAGALLILSLASYKFTIALTNGRTNVGFLVTLSIVYIIALFLICKPARLSKRGKAYLKELQNAFANLAQKDKINTNSPTYDPCAPALAMSIFGVGIFAGTSFDSFEQTFHRSTDSGSSCGSSCGSSGSSCGSGGSSCGGGGCGGCGGGGGCS